ncbi:hypothetical protein ASPACDRAFT_127284, partial [Aspergillus aculeatus ATCC 16872]
MGLVFDRSAAHPIITWVVLGCKSAIDCLHLITASQSCSTQIPEYQRVVHRYSL